MLGRPELPKRTVKVLHQAMMDARSWTTLLVFADMILIAEVQMCDGLLVREIATAYKCRRVAYAVLVELPNDVGLAFRMQRPPRVLQEEDLVL